jgi:hypothetical protein
MTEPDNPILDGAFNNASQLTIEFQARQATLAPNLSFLDRWNYGGQGTLTIGTGQHFGEGSEVSVWFAGPNGSGVGVVETQGANIQASVTEDIAVVFKTGQLQIYVNGVQEQTVVSYGAVPTSLAARNMPLNLGYWNGLGRYIDGRVVQLRHGEFVRLPRNPSLPVLSLHECPEARLDHLPVAVCARR